MNDATSPDSDSLQTMALRPPVQMPQGMDPRQGASPGDDSTMDSMRTVGPAWRTQAEPTGRHWEKGEAILGRYVVEGELGRGGMGVVYACLDKVGGVRVAVKVLPPEVAHDRAEMEDMRANFQLVGGLRHPNIAGVRTLEQSPDNEVFLVMDIAEGSSLRSWLKERWRGDGVSLEDALPILRQVASALDYAHKMRVVHRDVKPGNVMIDAGGDVKVLDFGLAEQIRTSMSRVSRDFGGTSGTRAYMAPEQWSGRRQDAKTDQYALASMAYEMLAGCVPFEGNDVGVLKDAVLHDDIEDIPNLPVSAMAALRRGMAKTRAERFETCSQFVDALSGTPVEAPKPKLVVRKPAGAGAGAEMASEPAPAPVPEPTPAKKRNGPWLLVAVVAAVALVLGCVTFGILKSSQAKSRAAAEEASENARPAVQEVARGLARDFEPAPAKPSEPPPLQLPEPAPPTPESEENPASPGNASWNAAPQVSAPSAGEAPRPPVQEFPRESGEEFSAPSLKTSGWQPDTLPGKSRTPVSKPPEPDPQFAPLEKALEAVQDNPAPSNYVNLEKVWKTLPARQKEATKKNVMWAICAMLLSNGKLDAVQQRKPFVDFQALSRAVTAACPSCNGNGHGLVDCRDCHGRGTCIFCNGRGWNPGIGHNNPCVQCNRTGKCPSCKGEGRREGKCEKCRGGGRSLSAYKCEEVAKENIGQALRICRGEE